MLQNLLETAGRGSPELVIVTFENQGAGGDAVLDARITARFMWWFETKTARGSYACPFLPRTSVSRSLACLRKER